MAIIAKFRDAARMQCRASVLIEGLSGRGKTGLALALSHALVGDWEKIAAVDTENNSMPLYCGVKLHNGQVVGQFKVGDLTADDGFSPSHYHAFRQLALESGMEALICDSISHMWQYKGGILDLVTQAQRKDPRLNKYTAWGTPEIVQEKNMIMDLIRHPKLHCINTVRVKEKMEFITGDDGKTGLKSLGEQQIVMPDLKYEPDLVLSMQQPGTKDGSPPVVKVIKSRYPPFVVDEVYRMTDNMMHQLKLFLEEGTSPEELEQMQQQEYIEAITQVLDSNTSAKTIWPALKKQAGEDKTALKDIPLSKLKLLFSQLMA